MEKTIDETKRIKAYNVKLKKKGEPMFNAVIDKNIIGNRTSYLAKGTTEDGTTKLISIISGPKAEEAINAGVAVMGNGWE